MPEILQNKSFEEIHKIMLDSLPSDIDKSEGGFPWDFTAPTALIAAMLCQQVLPGVIALNWPETSYGEYVDRHATTRGMERRAATAATGEITITGTPGTVIPAGYTVCDVSENGVPSVDYITTEETQISESGTVTVPIICKQTGTVGNTPAGTIIVPVTKISGVTGITNLEDVIGGTDIESDESLQDRIVEYDRTQGESFVGNVADYKRWSTSVDGVGAAVIIPANDDTGLVTIVLVDSNGAPATDELCEAVYNYIMRPDDEDKRLAPVNAYLSVIPPETLIVGIKAVVEVEFEATIESVQASYMAQLALYIPEALEDKEIKFTRIGAILSSIRGVNDYSHLEFGIKNGDGVFDYGVSNIPFTSRQLPIIEVENLILTPGTV